jgi:hypothetical protein
MSDFPTQANTPLSQQPLHGNNPPSAQIRVEGIVPNSQASSATEAKAKQQTNYNSPEAQARANKLGMVLSEMANLPLWVLQVIYTDLKSHLEKDEGIHRLSPIDREDFLQLWKPTLTPRGQEALESFSSSEPGNIVLLLDAFRHNDNVAMMCARYEWSLQNACHLLIVALREQYIQPPNSKILEASIRFLGDEIRIGEYLVFIGRLDRTQMQLALQTQEYIQSAMGEHTKIADILLRLELLTTKDVESILFLKEESRKPFRLF